MKDQRITSSLAAGGRWDDMIGKFAGSKEQIPAVGISFGLDVLSDAIKIVSNAKPEKSVVKAYVVPIKTEIQSIGILNFLRKNGIKADMDFNGRNISKNLEFANKLGIPYVVIAGPKEIAEGKVNLKEMESGKEEKVKIDDLAKNLK
jgi:histidyl-tRNA synthetase